MQAHWLNLWKWQASLEVLSSPSSRRARSNLSSYLHLLLLSYSVRIVDSSAASASSVKHDLPVPKVVALEFSPTGGYLSTWERPSKNEDGTNVKNLKIWDVQSGEEIASFEIKSREGW